MDGDGICDALDDDTDGDGTDDATDAFDDDACADTDTDGDGMPDTLVAGCTSTLTEDTDDDFDASNVQATYVLSIADSWNDGTYYAYVYSQSDGDGDGVLDLLLTCARTASPCTVTAGDVHIYVDTDYYYNEVTVSVAVDGTTVLTAAPTTSSLTLLGSLTAADYSAGVWTDADEATCGTDPLDSTSTPTDTDGDNLCDDAQDDDNDGDGFSNDDESTNCGEGNDPLVATDSPTDTDSEDRATRSTPTTTVTARWTPTTRSRWTRQRTRTRTGT